MGTSAYDVGWLVEIYERNIVGGNILVNDNIRNNILHGGAVRERKWRRRNDETRNILDIDDEYSRNDISIRMSRLGYASNQLGIDELGIVLVGNDAKSTIRDVFISRIKIFLVECLVNGNNVVRNSIDI
jgi:hypothetical protein